MRTVTKNALVLGSTLLATCMLTACSPRTDGSKPGGGTTQQGGSTYELQTPTLTLVSPSTVSLGAVVQVFGQNFIDPAHGTLALYLVGSFTDTDGNSTRLPGGPVQIPLTYVGAGQASFTFGPYLNPVSPTGQEIGTFSGNFQVVNTLTSDAANAQPNDTQVSAPQQLSLTLGPSIFIDQMRSVDDANCNPTTAGTIGAQDVAFGFHYVGMDDASADDPVTYTVQYDPTQVTAAFVANQNYAQWPFWSPHWAPGPNAPANGPQPTTQTAGPATFGMQINEGNSVVFNPQQQPQQLVTVNPPVIINQAQLSQVLFAGLATPDIAVGQTDSILLTVTATHQSGASITRLVNWTAYSALSFSPATKLTLSAWEAPMLDDHIGIVKGSAPNGTNMSYNESASDSKQKTITMNWNVSNSSALNGTVNAGINLGLPSFGGSSAGSGGGTTCAAGTGPGTVVEPGTTVPCVNTPSGPTGGTGGNSVNFSVSASATQTWSQTFGTDVSTSDTITTMAGSNTSVQVNPGMWGAFYIQWGDVTSSVTVNSADACGVTQSLGVATLTAHTGYLIPETATNNLPQCPVPQDCHPAGPVTN